MIACADARRGAGLVQPAVAPIARKAGVGGMPLRIRRALCLAAALATTAVQAAEKDPSCAQLKRESNSNISIYLRSSTGEVKSLEPAGVGEIAGRTTPLYLLLRRSASELRSGVSHGAANVKIELSQPGGDNNLVGLFNDHQTDATPCSMRNFLTYQQFHLYGKADNCLRHRFHNPPGDAFSTVSPPNRRALFAFTEPERNIFDWLFSQAAYEIKRMSFILNYTTSPQHPITCIPFSVTPSSNLSAFRFSVDDLYVDAYNQRLPQRTITR
jgi:hypothetical protein